MKRLVVLREREPGESRVALVPSDIPKLTALGASVAVETGAGAGSGYADVDYREAGVKVGEVDAVLAEPALVVTVKAPRPAEFSRIPVESILLCFVPPATSLDVVALVRERGLTALSFDLVPRVSRAQSVDALSSQAGAAGYQAAVLAADRLGRMMPMMMTAAGTVPPAKVLVLGAGVAGLQAIATAKRLGASVCAYDIRPEAAEEVRSLGVRFVELPLEGTSGTGGYAAEQSRELLGRQQELVARVVAESDIVITTAAVPGRRAPTLVTQSMVASMRRGSIVVDLAAGSGGNCELTRDGEEVVHEGVMVIGASNLASGVSTTASAMYSRNVVNVAQLLSGAEDWVVDLEDEVVGAMCIVADGVVRHEPTRVAMGAAY